MTRCSSTEGPPLGEVLLVGKKFGGLFSVERRWESSIRWKEVGGGGLISGTKLGGFYLVERSWEVLIGGRKSGTFYIVERSRDRTTW
jgi:hypothetical protein